MANVTPPQPGNVVQDFYIGNTHVLICDDYCRDKTPEEVQAILKSMADTATMHLMAAGKLEHRGTT